MTNSPTLTIIIVNYNGRFWLKKTLDSLHKKYLRKTSTEVTTVVVDNHSTDDSQTMIREEYPWVALKELPENKGFAYANNRALEELTTEYALLLNSDVELTDESDIDALIAILQANQKIGICTPKLIFPNGEIDPACHRGEPTPWASFTYFAKLHRLFPKRPRFNQYHLSHLDRSTSHAVQACSGAALLTRRKQVLEIGLLDERFFMYAEDLDWCARFREAGYAIFYEPAIKIIHHKNKSGIASEAKKIAQRTTDYFYDTMLQYYDKHYRHRYPRAVRWVVQLVLILKKGVR